MSCFYRVRLFGEAFRFIHTLDPPNEKKLAGFCSRESIDRKFFKPGFGNHLAAGHVG